MTSVEQAILAKLAEYGVALDAPDDELRRAFAGTVAPNRCFYIAKLMQARAEMLGYEQVY